MLRALPLGEAVLDDVDGVFEGLRVAAYAASGLASAGIRQILGVLSLVEAVQVGASVALPLIARVAAEGRMLQLRARRALEVRAKRVAEPVAALSARRCAHRLAKPPDLARFTSSATTCWVRPIERAIHAMRSPLFRPCSIATLSSYVSGRRVRLSFSESAIRPSFPVRFSLREERKRPCCGALVEFTLSAGFRGFAGS